MRRLLTFQNLLAILPISEATLRRRISESRRGIGNFPKSVNRPGRKLLFRPEDVELWVASQNSADPQPPIPESTRERAKRHAIAMKALAGKGVVLPSQK